MFLLGVIAIFQLVLMFIAVGTTSVVLCPAIRKLENGANNATAHSVQKRFVLGSDKSNLLRINEYKIPEYGEILR